jgi:hypothetical protein
VGGGPAGLLKSKAFIYKCADCDRQTSVTAATIMRANKLLPTIWFWVAFFDGDALHGISALQLQNRLGLESYWYRLNFVRQTRAAQCAPPWGQA